MSATLIGPARKTGAEDEALRYEIGKAWLENMTKGAVLIGTATHIAVSVPTHGMLGGLNVWA